MKLFITTLIIILTYLVGSIPFGLIIGKFKGIDIRENGSKNIGATNVGRLLGTRYAIITYLFDTLKGFVFVFIFRYNIINNEYMLLSPMIYGLIASLGHTYPLYLKLRGGKAVATSSGALLAYAPLLYLIGMITFFTVMKITKYVSVASLFSTSFCFIGCFIYLIIGKDIITGLEVDFYFPLVCFFLGFIIFFRHRKNIRRLINHEENKIK